MKALFPMIFLLVVATAATSQKKSNVLDENYKGGSETFYQLFQMNVGMSYPKKNSFGTTILYWEVIDQKKQNVIVYNSIDDETNHQIKNILDMTQGNWLPSESVNKYYLPIIIRSSREDFFVAEFPEYFLPKIEIVHFGGDYKLKSDNKMEKLMNKAISKNEFEKALKYLNEMIRRNPMSIELRKTRVFCYQKLQRDKDAKKDSEFISTFLVN